VADDGGVLLVVGPVDADAARAWTGHMLHNLEVVAEARERLPFRLPEEVSDDFVGLLRGWLDLAQGCDVFEWEARFDPERLRSLVRYWANLDALTDDQVAALGVTWSPPHARPFFEARARAVAEAFDRAGGPDPFAELLADPARVPGDPSAKGGRTARG
jgi:hypothetical protein